MRRLTRWTSSRIRPMAYRLSSLGAVILAASQFGCVTTPEPDAQLSDEARAALRSLGLETDIVEVEVDGWVWLILPVPGPSGTSPWIIRVIRGVPSSLLDPNNRVGLILTDGDVADLYRRITGKVHPTLRGDLSNDYKAFLEHRR